MKKRIKKRGDFLVYATPGAVLDGVPMAYCSVRGGIFRAYEASGSKILNSKTAVDNLPDEWIRKICGGEYPCVAAKREIR